MKLPWQRDIDFDKAREEMVRRHLASRDITDERVLDAFRKVPRERFVWQVDAAQAYADHPLHIAEGQTISQPYMVAIMTQALALKGDEKVLEIGTGSGYQTAILAELAGRLGEVFTIERHASLSESARELLAGLGYENIRYRVADGTLGWPEEAPFDRIIVTAGSPRVPEPLKAQLAPPRGVAPGGEAEDIDGGLLAIPVGREGYQDLTLVTRHGDGFRERSAGGCSFVKLIGAEGWPER